MNDHSTGPHAGPPASFAGDVAPSAPDTETETDGDAPAVSQPARRAPRWLPALTVGLFLGCLGFGLLSASLAGRLDDERGDRREVASVTGEVSEALFTYDHADLDRTRRRVLAVATGKFREEYESTFPSLEQLLTETKATAEATVKDVFVGEIRDGAASAIAVVDASVSGLAGANRRADSYLRVRLLKVDGRWRVDDALSINFGGSGGPTTSSASTTTSTTAPAAGAAPGE